MPRIARQKTTDSTYHIMCRSISEVNLFESDDDKRYYLSLLKRYCEQYQVSIYAYAIMSNHVHLYINPLGFDISTFMSCLNSAYVAYYNRAYNRHGHLFQGRFASVIVTSEAYSLTLSAYIHNNSKDIPGYRGREEQYPFSSYGIYLGLRKDTEGILDTAYILHQFSGDTASAREKYRTFVDAMRDTGIMKGVDEAIVRAYTDNEYRSEKKHIARDKNPEEVFKRICEHLGETRLMHLRNKYRRESSELRAFAAYAIRVLCGCTYKKICEFIGDMSLSGVTRLERKGYRLYLQHDTFRAAFSSLI